MRSGAFRITNDFRLMLLLRSFRKGSQNARCRILLQISFQTPISFVNSYVEGLFFFWCTNRRSIALLSRRRAQSGYLHAGACRLDFCQFNVAKGHSTTTTPLSIIAGKMGPSECIRERVSPSFAEECIADVEQRARERDVDWNSRIVEIPGGGCIQH